MNEIDNLNVQYSQSSDDFFEKHFEPVSMIYSKHINNYKS